jgi:PAS domain S-box-containing protein
MKELTMSHKDEPDGPVLKSITSIESLGWGAVEKFYALFAKLWTPVQLLLAAAGLGVAFYYGNQLKLSLLNTHNSMAKALAAKVEPTRDAGQGVVAFLFSNVGGGWTKVEHLNLKELTPMLQEVEKKIREVIQELMAEEEARSAVAAGDAGTRGRGRKAGRAKATPSDSAKLIGDLGLTVITEGAGESRQANATANAAVVGAPKLYYLAVPFTALHGKTQHEPPPVPKDPARLAELLDYNPEIKSHMRIAAEIVPLTRRAEKASGDQLTVVQTYFITELNVFVIRQASVKDQGQYYAGQFHTYTQQVDRPYVWEALDSKPGRVTPTPFDYVTKPYLDLGGNGFVVTFSKKFELPNHRFGVLCVDAKLPDSITNEIKKDMESMGATVSTFWWGEKGIESDGGHPLPADFSWFNAKLQESAAARSEVLGGITFAPEKAVGADGSVVMFTVPVTSIEDGLGHRRTRFLLVEFDSTSILKQLTTNLVLFTGGIILVIAVTWSLFWDYTRLKQEMSNVLNKLSKVMRRASTPFLWLDEENGFVDANDSFLRLMGYGNLEELKQHSPTFRGLVTAETQPTYDEVLANSGRGEETGEYEIDVLTKTGKVLHVRAHGERIPYPTLWRRGLPYRFGVFVEVFEPARAARPKPSTGKSEFPKELGIRT